MVLGQLFGRSESGKAVDREESLCGFPLIYVRLSACIDSDPRASWPEFGERAIENVNAWPPTRMNTKVWPDSGGFFIELQQYEPYGAKWLVRRLPSLAVWFAGHWSNIAVQLVDIKSISATIAVVNVIVEVAFGDASKARSLSDCSPNGRNTITQNGCLGI